MSLRRFLILFAGFAAVATPVLGDTFSNVIRVAVGSSGSYGKPLPSGLIGVGLEKGFFDREFAKDHIKVEAIPFAGNGVVMNEALATQQVDFSGGCTLPNVVGLAGWNNAHIVFVQRLGSNQYILAKPAIRNFEQLKGKRVGVQLGNISHILTVATLAGHHIKESDVQWVNLPIPEQRAAFMAGAVDAISGTVKDYPMRDKGVANIIGGTKDLPPLAINICGTLVSGAFEKAHPDLVARFVKVLTQLAWWGSQDANRAEYLRYNAKAMGIPYNNLDADTPNPLKPRFNPLIDADVLKGYQDAAQFAVSHRLIRSEPDVKQWFEPKYVNAALAQLGLQTYWPQASGKDLATLTQLGE